ncbi:MAG: hypothetical protein JXR36_02700 [Bacteroidales bacterium]|nr:hypothetical protein [Bacteroidales bacterium]
MKNKKFKLFKLTLFFLFVITNSANADFQTVGLNDTLIINGTKIASLIISNFGAKESFGSFEKTNFISNQRIEYNSSGMMIRKEDSCTDITSYSNNLFEYDDNNNLISEQSFNSNGICERKTKYLYNEYNQVLEENSYIKSNNNFLNWGLQKIKYLELAKELAKELNDIEKLYVISNVIKNSYNIDNNMEKSITFNENGETLEYTIFEYNSLNMVIKTTHFFSFNDEPTITTYSYNRNNLLEQKDVILNTTDTVFYKYLYNDKNQLILETELDVKSATQITKDYNNLGQLIMQEKIKVKNSGNLFGFEIGNDYEIAKQTISYNSFGDISYLITHYKNHYKGKADTESNFYTEYSYEYDQFGNWISCIIKPHGYDPRIKTREITYY